MQIGFGKSFNPVLLNLRTHFKLHIRVRTYDRHVMNRVLQLIWLQRIKLFIFECEIIFKRDLWTSTDDFVVIFALDRILLFGFFGNLLLF